MFSRLVFPSPLATPLSSCRCGFEGVLFGARPSRRSWASAPAPSQGLPQSRRGDREPSWRGQGCPQAAQRGGGLRRGLSPSHAARLPHPAGPPLRWEWFLPLLPFCRARVEICLPQESLSLREWLKRGLSVRVCGGSGGRGNETNTRNNQSVQSVPLPCLAEESSRNNFKLHPRAPVHPPALYPVR